MSSPRDLGLGVGEGRTQDSGLGPAGEKRAGRARVSHGGPSATAALPPLLGLSSDPARPGGGRLAPSTRPGNVTS